jgi:hypothetical protein
MRPASPFPAQTGARNVVVDECVGNNSALWRAFVDWLGERPVHIVDLRTQHEGIPDGAIVEKLLAPGDILVTADRVLHNRACADGIRSFTLDASGKLTDRPLAGVPRAPRIAPAPAGELKDDYKHEPHALTWLIRQGSSERELKGYRTRRRRIRSLFGGRDNISQLALTVGDLPLAGGTLCGFFLRVAGHGRKGLDATEGYCLDPRASHDAALCAIPALLDVYWLDLDGIRTEAFFLSEPTLDLCRRLMESEEPPTTAGNERSLHRLLHGLTQLTLLPCRKGPFRDEMTRKLRQLGRGGTNEIRAFDFGALALKLLP